MISDNTEGLKSKINSFEKWVDKNKIEVNEDKTKLMISRSGGKLKEESWEYIDREMEVVKEFKYLGYCFTT